MIKITVGTKFKTLFLTYPEMIVIVIFYATALLYFMTGFVTKDKLDRSKTKYKFAIFKHTNTIVILM